MMTRLAIFMFSLLLLPLAGLYLGGGEWSGLNASHFAEDESAAAALHTSMALLIYILLVNHVIKRLTGSAPLERQRAYFVRVCIAGALTGWQISYLNLFVSNWRVQQDQPWIVQLLLYTPPFALLVPAVLVTVAFFASFPVLSRILSRGPKLPAGNGMSSAVFCLLALAGLVAGAASPQQLYWLLWLSPPLLLGALQWPNKTSYSPAMSGDWGRIICSMLSGILVGNLAVGSYQSKASLDINLPNALLLQAGFALFGLLCLQLGEFLTPQPITNLAQNKT